MPIPQNLKGQTLKRDGMLDPAMTPGVVDKEKRTAQLAFSSEAPVDRGWGMEVLSHAPGAMRTKRMKSGLAMLREHDRNKHIGVMDSFDLGADKVGRAVVRFSRGALGQEALQDVEDGILRNVSVGYMVHAFEPPAADDPTQTYRVTDWEPMEVTLCAIPADDTVGVGRTVTDTPPVLPAPTPEHTQEPQQESRTMAEETKIEVVKDNAAETIKNERQRIAIITAIGKRWSMDAQAATAITEGTSADAFRAMALEAIGAKPAPPAPANIGLDDKEVKRYSIMNAVRAMEKNDWTKAGFELECSRAVEKMAGKAARGFFLAPEVLYQERTANNKTTSAQGGYLVGTQHMADQFVELLRNTSVAMRAGVRTLSGLVGDLAIPTQTGGATCYYLGEQTDVTESSQAWGAVSMTPKTIAAESRITRKMLLQSSPSIEALVRADLIATLSLGVDLGILEGSGGTQPTGVLNTASVNTVAFGGAPTYAKLVDMETEVAVDNALMGTLSYIGGARFAGKCKQTQKFSGTNGQPILENGMINGYPFLLSTNITATNCYFANWADVLVGFWSGLDITLDTTTYAKQGGLMLLAFQDYDVAVRHAASVCYSTGMTVT